MSTLFDVSEMLKQARGEARLSQDALASRADVSRSTGVQIGRAHV